MECWYWCIVHIKTVTLSPYPMLCHRLDIEIIKICSFVVTMLVQAKEPESSISRSASWLKLIKNFMYVNTKCVPDGRWILQAAGEVSSSSCQARSIPLRKKIVPNRFLFTVAKFSLPVLWQNSLWGKRIAWGTQQHSKARAKTWMAGWAMSSFMDFAESLRYGSASMDPDLVIAPAWSTNHSS